MLPVDISVGCLAVSKYLGTHHGMLVVMRGVRSIETAISSLLQYTVCARNIRMQPVCKVQEMFSNSRTTSS